MIASQLDQSSATVLVLGSEFSSNCFEGVYQLLILSPFLQGMKA